MRPFNGLAVAMSSDVLRAGRWNLVRGMAFAVITSLPPVMAARYLRSGDYMPWIVGFSLLPWLSVSQVGLQPGVLAVAGRLHRTMGPHAAAIVGRAALRASARQYFAVGVAGTLFVLLLSRTSSSFSALVDRPGLLASMLSVGMLLCLTSVGNSYMIAAGRPRLMAGLTALGAAIFVALSLSLTALSAPVGAEEFTVVLGLGLAVPTMGVLARLRGARHGAPDEDAQSGTTESELRSFVWAQAVWVVPGVLVSGLDNLLIAEFEPSTLVTYSVALSILTALTGALGAVTSPFIANISRYTDANFDLTEREVVRSRLKTLTVISLLFSAGTFCLVRIGTWLLATGGSDGSSAVLLLGAGLSIRMLTVPVSTAVVAAHRQRILFPSAIAEAVSNAFLSVALGWRYGAEGVAAGTLIGGLVAVSLHGRTIYRHPELCVRSRLWQLSVALPSAVLVILTAGSVALR